MVLVFVTTCSGKGNPPVSGANPRQGTESNRHLSVIAYNDAFSHTNPAWPALALLQTGENPLWFEFAQDGPRLIESPAAASLLPYAPWPHARHITGMTLWKDFLVMTVNRDGFLILGAAGDFSPMETTELLLYRAAAGFWDPYTIESFFIWDDKPAALLYRNDFFAEPGAPALRPQVYVLDFTSSTPLPARVPALEKFPDDGLWETELLHRGADGFWYYRMKKKGEAQNETAYFRAAATESAAPAGGAFSLLSEGERISFGEWMNSNRPESPENAPPDLARILARVAGLGRGSACLVRTVSPDFEGQKLFSSAANLDVENLEPLFACLRTEGSRKKAEPSVPRTEPQGAFAEPLALAIFPDGSGFYSYGAEKDVRPFLLAPLPDGFVYTGVAVLGNVIAASWEEQQEAGIGAAGFMVVSFNL